MTTRQAPACALLACLVLAAPSHAQSPPSIEQVRIGLPSGQAGQQAGRSRNAAWAPVAVTLLGGSTGHTQGLYRLRIETRDLEEVRYQYTVAVPAMAAGARLTVQGYIVPGGDGSVFRVALESAEGRVIAARDKISRDTSRDEVIGNEDILYFTVGSPLPGLRRSAEKIDRPDGKEPEGPVVARRQFATADDVSQLPDRWFGYDAADVVLLTSGNRDLITQLEQEGAAARRSALLTWVRRGGQLVLSVGRNHQEVARLLKKLPLIDVQVTGAEKADRLPTLSQFGTSGEIRDVLAGAEVATVAPGPGVHVILRQGQRPLIMQAACGLGRVVLVALDLDAPPFITWNGQQEFWSRMQDEVAPPLHLRKAGKPGRPGRQPGAGLGGLGADSRYDMKTQLKRNLELFEEVPTISFGWVALFILFYILLVGPLDYFVLKKVFKRLEWTWVTFPATVLVVSVAAYLIAYRVKGDDVRINKVDLVEVDLHQPRQAYGHTYFTLFSPRVQSYTIGLAPDGESWFAPPPEGAVTPVVTLLEGGDRPTRAGTQALFSRPYEYAPDAAGLLRVPVSVWSTRSFTAAWQAPLRDNAAPIGIDGPGALRQRADEDALVGQVTNNLPTELRDVTLFYRDRLYSLKKLAPGESFRIDQQMFGANAAGQRREIDPWFEDEELAPGTPLAPSGRPINAAFAQGRSAYRLIKPLLFFRAWARPDTSNAGLRHLDQSWRIRRQAEFPPAQTFRDEAILVARAPLLVDHAEAVTTNGASPSRLWLGQLPTSGGARPDLPGYITQETYLRVYIPVKRER